MSDQLDVMLAENQPNYKPEAWKNYSLAELCNWVDNFTKRADHRADDNKKAKDLQDAQNYLDMIRADAEKFMQVMQDKIDVAKNPKGGT